MKVLVVGGGGREHALIWKLSQSPRVTKLYCAPGNAGTAELAEPVDIPADALERLAEFAAATEIDLTVIGPEAPLTAGITDVFARRGLRIFGPSGDAAIIEGSKAFAKDLMQRYGIPSADYRTFTDASEAHAYLDTAAAWPLVVKADGLAAGKGVIIAADRAEAHAAVDLIMGERAFGAAGDKLIIEECLVDRPAGADHGAD